MLAFSTCWHSQRDWRFLGGRDTSSPQLVHRLYAEANKGQSAPEALRCAQLALLRSVTFARRSTGPFQLSAGS